MPPATQGRNLKGLGSIMKKGKRVLFAGVLLLVLFGIWTLLIQTADVQPAGEIRRNLLAQLTAPVRWTQTVLNMAADGADTFIETGPGKVLQGLVSKIIGR